VSGAARLLDWRAAARIGRRLSGAVPPIGAAERAHLVEEFSAVVIEADEAVSAFTGLHVEGPRSRPWVMTRGEWIAQNLRGFEQVLDPVARRLLEGRDGGFAPVRRQVLAYQVGGLLGYLSRKVLGQYDLFLPGDDRDLVYFVGPNVVELERKHRFPPRAFRLWLALHEVTHRLQFEGVPWLRGYLAQQVAQYVDTLELDPRALLDRLRRAREELQHGSGWKDMGVLAILMTAEQRETFRRMQGLMSLLEGHASYVMDHLGEGRVEEADRMRRTLQERRQRAGINRAVSRAVGLDVKVRQYDMGQRFVEETVAAAGEEGFARVWERPEHLPTLDEIGRPQAWVDRVASG
jgi:coenzyme F420 biosynthesis associated uncharacterized protein